MKTHRHPAALLLAVILAFLTATGALAATPGSLDPSFGGQGFVITDLGGTNDSASELLLQPDGKILVAASANLDPQNPYYSTPVLLRYNPDGTLDASFGTDARVLAQVGAHLALQPDGKLLAAGSYRGDFAVARLNPNGSLDPSFGVNGIAILHYSDFEFDHCNGIALQPDGGILLAGYEEIGNFAYFMLTRFTSTGEPDMDFNRNAAEVIWAFTNNRFNYGMAVAIQSDGRIVMSGSMQDYDGIGPRITLARFNPNGTLDSTFGTGGTVRTDFANFQHGTGALAIQPDGRIVVAGTSFASRDHPTDDLAIARFNTDGSLDTSLGGTGILLTDFGAAESGFDLALQADGRILALGRRSDAGLSHFLLARYNPNGSLDASFGAGGKVLSDFGSGTEMGRGLALQPDGQILVTGASGGDVALARYNWRNTHEVRVAFRSSGTPDGWILESGEMTEAGGSLDRFSTVLNLGDDARDRQYRAVLSFNTSGLPDNAVITSARLRLKRQGLVGTDPFTTHGLLRLQIRRGPFSNHLALQLSDFSAPPSPGSVRSRIVLIASPWYQSTLGPFNLAFINKTGVTQFRLAFALDDNDDRGADYLKFFSGDSLPANKPQLIVTYYIP